MGGDTIGDIHYFNSTTDGCPPCVIPCSVKTEHRSNIERVSSRMTIHDLRGRETSVSIDTNGFEILKYNGSIQEEFIQGSEAQQTYYKEMGDILKHRLNASKVIIYNYAFRSRGVSQPDEKYDDNHREAAFYPHVDIAASAVPGLVEKLIGKEEAEKAMCHRVQVLNVWRPLGSNAITHNSFTICDYQSINIEKDVHPYTVQGAMLHSAGYLVSRNDENTHKWYYLSKMRSDEMYVFKMADTKNDVARVACHTAFINENEPTPTLEQKSVEIRCLLLYAE